jgi:hypothetical protein
MGLTVTVRFSLAQFSEVFRIRDAAGRPYVLIGGQAVNYWAERYLPTEPALQKLLPFTSEDIDFKGNREDVQRIADQLAQLPVYPPKVALTALAGAVPFRIGGVKSNIEIVRRVPGVSATAIDSLAIEAECSGRQIRVLDPISLLAGKLELTLTIAQTNRRDAEHVRILIHSVRGFLRELLAGVHSGDLPVKGWLGAVNRILKLAKSAHGRKVAKRLDLDWQEALPRPEIAKSTQVKIVAFREQQLSRWNPE